MPSSTDADPTRVAVYAVPAAMLLLGLADMPYGYYQFLRLVVCGAAILAASWAYEAEDKPGLTTLALTALLYNPVFRIHFDRETWSWINVVTVLVFVVTWLRSRRKTA